MNISDIIKTVKNPSKELVALLVFILVVFSYIQGVVVPEVRNRALESAAVVTSKSYNTLAPGQGPCIPSTTVKCGIIRIIKNTIPDNYQDFNFTTNITGYPSTFTLDDDVTLVNPSPLSNVQYFNVFNGNYNVAEVPAVPGYTVTVSCSDPSGGTIIVGSSVSISVSNHENITCTFRNTGTPQTTICVPTPTIPCGKITIIKDTVPDDYQDFAFSNTVPGYPASFTLDDDATLTNPSVTSNTATFTTPMSGSFTIAETTSLTGYTVSIACIDPSGGTITSGVTANISIANGENVVCTFTNTNTTTAACTSDTWTQKTDFGGVKRVNAVSFSLGNKGYLGTGWDTTLGNYLQDFWEYNPVTNVWTQKADVGGVPRNAASGFSIGTKGYIGIGAAMGGGAQQDFWEYDPTTNTWTQKANFGGGPREYAAAFSINTKGYIGTGGNGAGIPVADFWEYNPTTNIWTQKASYGGGAVSIAVGLSIGTKGYIGTGNDINGSRQDFWEYTPAPGFMGGTWTQKANFGGGLRHNLEGFSIGNKGYLGTGINAIGDQTQDFWEYTPAPGFMGGTWTQKANFGGGLRVGATSFSIGTKGYMATGYGESYWNPLTNMWDLGYQDLWEYCP